MWSVEHLRTGDARGLKARILENRVPSPSIRRFAYWRTGTHAADAAMRMIHNRRRACSASDAMPMSQTDMKRQWNPMMSNIFDKKV